MKVMGEQKDHSKRKIPFYYREGVIGIIEIPSLDIKYQCLKEPAVCSLMRALVI